MTTSPVVAPRRRRWVKVLLWIALPLAPIVAYFVCRFSSDRPVDYPDIVEHFKYGSTGGERASGLPYEMWQAMASLFADKLPGPGYASLGFIYEKGKDLPVGTSRRHLQGIDRVFVNCAVCHSGTVRDDPGSPPQIYVGMPANNFDIYRWTIFLFDAAADERFTPQRLLLEMKKYGDIDLINDSLLRYYALYLARERLLMIRERLAFIRREPEWGPGRVNTFAMAKALLGFDVGHLPDDERIGASDFPSIWRQGPRQGMQLHWDGNNTDVTERNKSAAFGTGTTPPTIDLGRIGRLEKWLWDVAPPPYRYPIDTNRAATGGRLYAEYCASCHGRDGKDFTGERVGKVTPIDDIRTDRHRLDSYTYDLAVSQNVLYAGYPWRFKSFRKTFGYANAPLDGLWLRGPYLHNGSVPTLRDLLEPAANRPPTFYRGYDVFDRAKVGFVSNVAEEKGHRFFLYDTKLPGNSNSGHEGRAYGTELPAADKDAIVEFLKTF